MTYQSIMPCSVHVLRYSAWLYIFYIIIHIIIFKSQCLTMNLCWELLNNSCHALHISQLYDIGTLFKTILTISVQLFVFFPTSLTLHIVYNTVNLEYLFLYITFVILYKKQFWAKSYITHIQDFLFINSEHWSSNSR